MDSKISRYDLKGEDLFEKSGAIYTFFDYNCTLPQTIWDENSMVGLILENITTVTRQISNAIKQSWTINSLHCMEVLTLFA